MKELKEYNRKELRCFKIGKNVTYNEITNNAIKKCTLEELIESYIIVQIRYNLRIKVTSFGMICHNEDYKFATNVIQKSVLFN